MFDPAALLIKTIGLALPVEAANGPAGQQPGDSVDAAGNGGFAGLLALKLESAEPAGAVPAAAQMPVTPAVSLVAQPAPVSTPIGWTAKALPATGNILPPALPPAAPPGREPIKPATIAPSAPHKAQTSPVSAESAAIPEPAVEQAAPATAAPSRRAVPRAAVAVAAVLTETGEAPVPPQDAAAPQAAMPSALPPATTKPRPAAARSSKPDLTEADEPEQKDLAKAEAAPLFADFASVDPVTPAPVAAAVAVQAAEPVAVEFAPASSGKAPLAAAPVLPAEIAAPLLQTDAAPAPAMSAQDRVALRLPAAPGRQEGEASQSAAPAHRTEEPSVEAAQPAASRAMAAPAALPLAAPAPTHGHAGSQAPATVETPADFAQIVDRLVAARDAVAPAEVRVTLDHAQFGKVSVGFTLDASGMNVTLAAADPEFARAVEAAAPFTPPVTSEAPQVTASSPARGGDLPATLSGQQGQQPGRQQQPADPRAGTAQANPSNRTPDSEARNTRGRGIFA